MFCCLVRVFICAKIGKFIYTAKSRFKTIKLEPGFSLILHGFYAHVLYLPLQSDYFFTTTFTVLPSAVRTMLTPFCRVFTLEPPTV